MSSHVRQHKSPYFYVRKGAGFVLLENHVETGTRYKTEAEAKRAVLALNDAWRAQQGRKANPVRTLRNSTHLAARLEREQADLDAAEKELAFLLPLAGKNRQFDERIAYLRDLVAGLHGDILLTKAEMRRNPTMRRNPEMDSLMAREAQLVAELTALRREYSEAATDISYFHDQLMRQRTAIEYQHAATLRPLETKYYAAKQQADALHERILPLQRELDALRREIQKNKPKDGPTWDFRQTEFNPRRRNPGAAGEVEMILWARPAGQTDALYEQPIYTQGRTMEDIERVKKLAAKEGWHTFRVQRIDLSKPYNAQKEFAATIRGSRRRNPPMRRNYSGAPMLVWHDEKPSFGVDRDHVATHGEHTYIIYQHPGDGPSVFHIDRETKGMPPYPMGSRSTLTKAKEAAQRDLEGLEAARSGYPEWQNPAGKYVEGRDAKGFRKLSDLKHGEYFKLKKDSRKVYRKGDYDRSERQYACEDEDDISNEILVLGDRLVYVGFMY